jgi:hypothetical protein
MVKVQSSEGKKPQIRSVRWPLVAVALLIVCMTVIALSLLGPAVSNVFSNVTNELVTTSGSSGSDYTGSIAAQVPSRVIIREGYITLVAEDTQATKGAIEGIVGEMESEGAFIVTSEERADVESQMPTVSIVIRVPTERFDEVMDRLAVLAVRVEEQREMAQDVTEECVDLQGRLASVEAARDRLRGIMGEAETMEELLLAKQQLAEQEAEIESLRERLEYLTQSANLSRGEITLRPSVLSQPVAGLVRSLQEAANVLIYFGIVVLPWLVVVGLVVYGVRRYRAPRVTEESVGRSLEERVD